jgi:guanylate kinase
MDHPADDTFSIEPWLHDDVAFAVVISGPSGVGKTSLVDRLLRLDPRCTRSVSMTTRPPRPEERDGMSYTFTSASHFEEMRAAGAFAESALYSGHWYGTPKSFLKEKLEAGLSVVLNIEVQGGAQVRASYPDAVLIFVIPPSWEELRQRLLGRRTEKADIVEARIRRGYEEMLFAEEYDYVAVNDDVDRCAGEIASIVLAERRRTSRLRIPGSGRAS